MGVPHLFRHFARRCPRAIEVLDPLGMPRGDCRDLMIDFNSLIHLSARSSRYPCDIEPTDVGFEAHVIEGCVDRVRKLILRMSPTGEVFLAIDGVPPRAKMAQQRSRRYASDAARNGKGWDTNAVTPGTRFMATLGERLHAAFSTKNVVVSGSDEPGEGEQKIFERLRCLHRDRSGQAGGLIYVYGLDADLMLMAMTHPFRESIRIVRENDPRQQHQHQHQQHQHQQQQQQEAAHMLLQVVNAGILAKHAAAEISRTCGPGCCFSDDSARVREFAALCGLLGNDFAPALPSLSIREGGVDAVVRALGVALASRSDLSGRCLSAGGPRELGGLDTSVLSAIAEVLARDETGAMLERERRHAVLVERQQQHHRNRADRDDYFPLRNPPDFGWLLLGKEGCGTNWRETYYRFLFQRGASRRVRDDSPLACACISYSNVVHVEEVHAIAKDYAATLAWSLAYLVRGECLSLGWAYPHTRAPTALDLHLAMLAPPANVATDAAASFEAADRAHARYRTSRSLQATSDPAASWQLMQVLPPRSAARLLEAPALELAKSIALSHLYPATFSVCTYLCERLYECPTFLPTWSGEFLRNEE